MAGTCAGRVIVSSVSSGPLSVVRVVSRHVCRVHPPASRPWPTWCLGWCPGGVPTKTQPDVLLASRFVPALSRPRPRCPGLSPDSVPADAPRPGRGTTSVPAGGPADVVAGVPAVVPMSQLWPAWYRWARNIHEVQARIDKFAHSSAASASPQWRRNSTACGWRRMASLTGLSM